MNFVAAVLHTLARQLGGAEAFTTREAVMAALVARNACIEGDTAAVDEFSRAWLHLGRPQAWRAAVEMALLGDWVEALGRHLSGDAEIMELLHRHTQREHDVARRPRRHIAACSRCGSEKPAAARFGCWRTLSRRECH
ncbi:hypothetical protein [Streptomyces sp. NPDC096012]|uniref:hypothetical protein n=1 Tax=Streptomyces sp. NPDC096012 TaxID=3155684 RepID=UPI00336A7B60